MESKLADLTHVYFHVIKNVKITGNMRMKLLYHDTNGTACEYDSLIQTSALLSALTQVILHARNGLETQYSKALF